MREKKFMESLARLQVQIDRALGYKAAERERRYELRRSLLDAWGQIQQVLDGGEL